MRARGLPPSPSPMEMKGEKQKAVSPGWVVLLIRLVRPNTKPKNPPAFGPSKIEPTITGMWMVVACTASTGILM